MMAPSSEERILRMQVNGVDVEASAEPRMTLADFLRHRLRLTGTHIGCEHGVCGACTVLVDGVAVRGCLMFAVQADGRQIGTVEGLAKSGSLHPLQLAFMEHHGLQCGYCTPGILMTLTECISEIPSMSDEQLREALSGNLCRCTGYQNIVKAARHAAVAISQAGPELSGGE